jgi:O-succinylbenzoate synthase
MIHLTRLTLREIRLPLVEPFRSAGGEVTERRVPLLELEDASGITVWSECVAEARPGYSADTVDSCWLAITEWLAPRLLGATFASPAEVDVALRRGVRGHRMARAALEMGAWALAAELQDLSLAALLARSCATPATPRDHVETGVALGMQPTLAALVAKAQDALTEGYRRVKIKIEPGHGVEPVRALREALGPDAVLTADANCSYSMEDSGHVAALEALDAFGLSMLEQPLGDGDLVRHAALQRRLATAICLDESITGADRAADMISLGSGRVVNLKPGRVGGFAESVAVHDLCAAQGTRLWCGGMLESGIGRAYNVALASLPGFTDPGDLSPSARYWARDVVRPEWTMDAAGRVRVPLARPGLGIDVDVDRIEDLTVRRVDLPMR